jgi:hypothetical protein
MKSTLAGIFIPRISNFSVSLLVLFLRYPSAARPIGHGDRTDVRTVRHELGCRTCGLDLENPETCRVSSNIRVAFLARLAITSSDRAFRVSALTPYVGRETRNELSSPKTPTIRGENRRRYRVFVKSLVVERFPNSPG